MCGDTSQGEREAGKVKVWRWKYYHLVKNLALQPTLCFEWETKQNETDSVVKWTSFLVIVFSIIISLFMGSSSLSLFLLKNHQLLTPPLMYWFSGLARGLRKKRESRYQLWTIGPISFWNMEARQRLDGNVGKEYGLSHLPEVSAGSVWWNLA